MYEFHKNALNIFDVPVFVDSLFLNIFLQHYAVSWPLFIDISFQLSKKKVYLPKESSLKELTEGSLWFKCFFTLSYWNIV